MASLVTRLSAVLIVLRSARAADQPILLLGHTWLGLRPALTSFVATATGTG